MATKKNEDKTVGELILNHLRKNTSATTEKLASVTGKPVKDVYSRCWWLSKKEGLLKSKGKGASREWELSARGRKTVNPPPPAA